MKFSIWRSGVQKFVLLLQTKPNRSIISCQLQNQSRNLRFLHTNRLPEYTVMEVSRAASTGSEGHTDKENPSAEVKSDHLTRTSNKARDEGVHLVKVEDLMDLSPTVKEIVLSCEQTPPPFSFKAGQWVDVFIPGVETVGGFSMCSSPQELSRLGLMRLAVKFSDHPPAKWMHKNCRKGVELKLRVGGDFHLSCSESKTPYSILLVAGGVGINPLCSIARYVEDGKREGLIHPHTKVVLLYSAKTEDELIFRKVFDRYNTSQNGFFIAKYFVTGTQPDPVPTSEDSILYRRIDPTDLKTATDTLTRLGEQQASENSIQAYICGPPPMISCVTEALKLMEVTKINFEQWW